MKFYFHIAFQVKMGIPGTMYLVPCTWYVNTGCTNAVYDLTRLFDKMVERSQAIIEQLIIARRFFFYKLLVATAAAAAAAAAVRSIPQVAVTKRFVHWQSCGATLTTDDDSIAWIAHV